MQIVAVVTNLRNYHWTIKQSRSAGDGTHRTHVPWCVQFHVKTQLTFWQHPPFCFHLPFCVPVPAYPVCGLCWDLALYLCSLDYHIHIHSIERYSAMAFFFFFYGWWEGAHRDLDDMDKVGSESADFSEAKGVTAVLLLRGLATWIGDDLPIVHERRLRCARSRLGPCPLPTSSDLQQLPIHLPSLCTEVTAGIQLFVKGL